MAEMLRTVLDNPKKKSEIYTGIPEQKKLALLIEYGLLEETKLFKKNTKLISITEKGINVLKAYDVLQKTIAGETIEENHRTPKTIPLKTSDIKN
ncbi:hypothetical protein TALC_00399 [Thermoplasmatales archaeon BRNA1]|nr:hypothetical protein TALC_00399 [Thermoplasmatales archaeon BRNA1]